jgi:hypothetical protein
MKPRQSATLFNIRLTRNPYFYLLYKRGVYVTMSIVVSRKYQNKTYFILKNSYLQASTWALPRPPRHPFHIVTLRPWPIAIGALTLGIAGGMASWLHGHRIDLIV